MAQGGSSRRAERIAVFTKNLVNPNYAAMRLGVDRAAAALGAASYHRVPQTPDDPTEQIAMLAALADEKPDAIVFNPADVARLAGPFRAFAALGIPAINIVNRADYADQVAFVGTDDEKIGYVAAQHLLQAMGGKGGIVVLEGPASATTARDRARGFQRALAAHPAVRVTASADGRYQEPDALAQMRAILAKGTPVEGILAANDAMALGALAALAEAGRAPVPAVGINGIPEAVRAIAEGRLLASVDFNGFTLGCIAGMAAVRHLRGLPVPRTIHLPMEVIDKSNCAKFMVPLEQQQCPAWEELVG